MCKKLSSQPEREFVLERQLDVEIRWLLAFVAQTFLAAAGDATPEMLIV